MYNLKCGDNVPKITSQKGFKWLLVEYGKWDEEKALLVLKANLIKH